MKMLIILSLFILPSAYASVFKIDSNPQKSEVEVIDAKTGAKTSLGLTPLFINMDKLKFQFGDNAVIQLDVKKEGFKNYHLAVPVIGGDADIKIFADLEVDNDIKLTQNIDLLMGDLFDVLRMVRVQDFKNSMKKLERLEEQYPHYSIIYEMKGMIFYLKKNFKQALNFYRKSFGLNPQNREAYRMKVYLEKKFNVNPSAGSEG